MLLPYIYFAIPVAGFQSHSSPLLDETSLRLFPPLETYPRIHSLLVAGSQSVL